MNTDTQVSGYDIPRAGDGPANCTVDYIIGSAEQKYPVGLISYDGGTGSVGADHTALDLVVHRGAQHGDSSAGVPRQHSFSGRSRASDLMRRSCSDNNRRVAVAGSRASSGVGTD